MQGEESVLGESVPGLIYVYRMDATYPPGGGAGGGGSGGAPPCSKNPGGGPMPLASKGVNRRGFRSAFRYKSTCADGQMGEG